MSESTPLAERLLVIITSLKRTIHRVGHPLRVDTALLYAISGRLGRLMVRFQTLARRPLPILPAAAPPTKPTTQQSKRATHPKPEALMGAKTQIGAKLPTGKFWIQKLLPSHWLNGDRYFLAQFLDDPETIALVAQNPQFARQVFRPLCRMFSLPFPPHLKLPPRPKLPGKPRPPRIRKPKPKPLQPPEPTFLDYLLAKYPPTDTVAPQPSQIRKIFSR